MKENRKVKNGSIQQFKYKMPRVWCFPIETEGIMASSLTTGKSVEIDMGSGGGMTLGQKGHSSETLSSPW